MSVRYPHSFPGTMRRDSPPVLLVYRLIERTLLPPLERAGVRPDQLSICGLVLSALAGGGFALFPPLGATLLLPAGFCDLLDGLLARRLGSAGRAGAFLDSVLDRYGEVFLTLGIWYRLHSVWPGPLAAGLVTLLFLSGSLLVSYTRARGEGLGVSCGEGLLQRPERLLLLGAAGLCDPLRPGTILFGALVLLALGTHLTALQRFFALRTRLAGPESSDTTKPL